MSAKGTYVLILQLKNSAKLQIGKLGRFDFKKGYYAYVGSAFGPGGLAARLKHHLTLSANPHWHIDYLRKTARVVEVWVGPGPKRHEHTWAEKLSLHKDARCPVKGFGSSDCGCHSHLTYFEHKPSPVLLSRTLTGAIRQN